MNKIVSGLFLCLVLAACSDSPTKEEIAEIKEQEKRFMAVCTAKHVRDKNFAQCDIDFKEQFGYDYEQSFTQKALNELKGGI